MNIMYIELHDESADGAIFYRNVYDLGEIPELIPYDINTPLELSGKKLGYYDNTNPSVVQNYAETYGLPLTDESDGNILTDSIFPVPGTGQYEYKCYNENPESFEQLTIGTKPDDFDTNPHYCWFTNWTAPDGNNYYCQVPSAKMTWSATEQYWYDKEHKISKRIFAGPISFYISKLIDCDVSYWNNTRAWIQWGANVVRAGSGYPNTASFIDIPAAHNCMTYNDDAIKYGQYEEYIWDRTNMPSSSGGLTMNGNLCCSCFFVKCSRNNIDYVGIGILQKTYDYFGGAFTRLSLRVINADIFGDIIHEGEPPEPPTPENWGDDSTTGGGNGTFENNSDNRGDGDGKYFYDSDAGTGIIININSNLTTALSLNAAHGMNIHQILTDHMRYIYEQLYTSDYIEIFQNAMYNPLSAILNLHMIPQEFINATSTTGNSTHLTASGYDISQHIESAHSGVNANYPTLNAVSHYHVGKLAIRKYFDAYPDFAPYTKMILHLPFCGTIEIDTNAAMWGEIAVDYLCDLTNGNCVAFVWCNDKDGHKTYKYTATGNCGYSMPLYAYNQDGSAVQKMINSAFNIAVGGITGNISSIGKGVASIADSALDMAFSNRNTQIIGNISGNNSMISDVVCYLEIIRPVWINPAEYKMLSGIPSELSGKLSAIKNYPLDENPTPCDGYTVVSSIELETVDATQDEKNEIETLLKSGVYIRGELL